MTHVTWRCACGKVEAKVPAKGNRITCYCNSCRDFVQRLGADECLDPYGGSDLLQTDPKDVSLTKGAENLVHTRLTDKGPLRWYAGCCNTPMANTLPTRTLPFASFQTFWLDPKDALPASLGMVHLRGATGQIDHVKKASLWRLIGSLMSGTVKAHLTGKAKQNAFFNASGTPLGVRKDVL